MYSLDASLSKSKTDMPTSELDGRLIDMSIAGHAYARRFASFAAPVQQAGVVHVDAKQLHPDA